MNDLMEKGFDKVHAFEKNVLKKVFPNARLKQSSLFGSPYKIPKSFSGNISSSDLFSDTPYEYKGNGLFLHFTTFPILSAILSSGFLRMSDFNCLTDNSELLFASQHLFYPKKDVPNNVIEEKSNLFSLSACESSHNIIQSSYMWNNYSNLGKGCAIEYKFSSMNIFNFSLGNIQYGKQKLLPLKKFNSLAEKFGLEHDFKVSDVPLFIARISSFHKDKKFARENEVRLLFHKDGGFGSSEAHLNEYRDFHRDSQVRNFIKVFIKGRNPHLPHPNLSEQQVLMHSPQIELTKIIIGPENDNNYETIEHLIQIRKQFKMDFEIWRVNQKYEYFKINFQ